jgi:GNAT superfamily N-acetyltransferase
VSAKYTVSTRALPSAAELARLFAQVDWARHRTRPGTRRLLKRTKVFVTVRDGQRLVGFGRALTDGLYRALVDDIIVDASHRNRGIGALIVGGLMKELSSVEEVFLNTGPHLERFYGRHGFREFGGLTMKAEPAPRLRRAAPRVARSVRA